VKSNLLNFSSQCEHVIASQVPPTVVFDPGPF